MRTRILAAAVLLRCLVVCGAAKADNIPVANNSFETTSGFTASCGTGCAYNFGPVPGWTTTGATGSFEPGGFLSPVPDGSVVAFTNGGSLSQDLGVTLLADTTYTLSVFVGDRTDLPGTYTIALDAGTVAMCSSGGATSSITPGGFADETCSFTTGSTVAPGDLTVWLIGESGQADFDDVSVTAPEPAEIGMLAIGLFAIAIAGILSKRKQGLQDAA
jgi:hypothetical protein